MRSLLVVTAVVSFAPAAESADLREQIETYVERHRREIVDELVEVVSIPDVASDRLNIQRKAERLRDMLAKRGFSSEVLPTMGNPLVYGELRVPNARRTLLLYAHYDGQPVDPSQWAQEDPFRPVLRDGKLEEGGEVIDRASVSRFEDDWRLYGRSTSDDTSPIVALLAAVDALRASSVGLTSHLRVVLDGEEEDGSPSLTPAIDVYRDKLGADFMLILDGPIHPSGHPTLVYGARGILTIDLTTYGPRFPLHSGHYGNWAPNPAIQLARLLASMKDEKGRTRVEGFYDGVTLSEQDRRVLDAVPDDHEALMKLFGFAEPDGVGSTLQEALQFPSLNVRGLRSGWVGSEARTIVPDRAVAALDIRLVKETSADALYQKILQHVQSQGFHVVHDEPDDAIRARDAKIVQVRRSDATPAYRTALDDPRAEELVDALTEIWGMEPVRLRTSGGTVPIAPFIEALAFPAVSVPIVNFDNNQHSPNENLRLGHFFDGIVTLAAALTM